MQVLWCGWCLKNDDDDELLPFFLLLLLHSSLTHSHVPFIPLCHSSIYNKHTFIHSFMLTVEAGGSSTWVTSLLDLLYFM